MAGVLPTLAVLLTLCLAAAPASAQQATTVVPNYWGLIPSGLGPGDEFRLLFVSSTDRNAVPKNIGTYNTWIQNLAANGHGDIRGYSSTFRVVGSTRAVDARDNTETTGTGVPIYWLNGDKVADNYADFYDGSWDQEASIITNGVPDYTGAAIKQKYAGLRGYQERLAAMTIDDWPVWQKVDYHLVRAEMNAVEFHYRVLKPWARDPGFYSIRQGDAGPSMNVERFLSPLPAVSEIQTVRLPRLRRPASYSRQFLTR